MSFVGAGGTGGGRGGGGRDDRLKKKFDDTPAFAAVEDDEDEPIFPDVDLTDDDAAPLPENPSASASAAGAAAASGPVVEYRGVRRYGGAGGSGYRTTYVSCINNRDSPHNNRQIWLGRYYEVRAAAMAYDVFCFFNHHENYVNFPELLHLYAQVVPRRGINTDGTSVPITASDLERIKHVGLGVIRAFYPNSCAAIHTRRNQKALPTANPALTAQQRQNAASLQAAYHSQIEERTRNHVLSFIAGQQPLAQQLAGGSAAGPSSLHAPEYGGNRTLPLSAASLDFSSIQIPSRLQIPHASTHDTHIDFSAVQVPQSRAFPSTSDPRVGEVRQAPTSPDLMQQPSSTRQHIGPSNTTSFAHSSSFPAQNPFAQLAPPAQITTEASHNTSFFGRHGSSPGLTTTQTGHVGRPAPTRILSSSELSVMQALGLIPEAQPELSLMRALGLIEQAPTVKAAPYERPSPLARSNIEGTRIREEGIAAGRGIPFEKDPYREAAEARLYAERLRAERLNREGAPASDQPPGASSFPLLQRLSELSQASLQKMDDPPRPAGSLASPRMQRSSEPLLGAHSDLRNSLRTRHGFQSRSSAFSSYKAADNVQGGSASRIPGAQDVVPLRPHLPGDHGAQPESEGQKVVLLRRQSPEELALFALFDAAAAETATANASAPHTASNLQGASISNVEASPSRTFSVRQLVEQQEGSTSRRPVSTELTLELGGAPYIVRAPLIPDLNLRAPSDESSEALRVVSNLSGDPSPQDNAPINIRELQRVSTLGPSWQNEGSSRQPQEEPPKSKEEEDYKGKGKEKAED